MTQLHAHPRRRPFDPRYARYAQSVTHWMVFAARIEGGHEEPPRPLKSTVETFLPDRKAEQ